MRLADHVILYVNNTMSKTAVFLNVDTTWHSGLQYKLLELEFLTSLVNLIASFVTDSKFKVLVEGEFSMPRKVVSVVLQVSVLAPVS
jgi:hypothetical protein